MRIVAALFDLGDTIIQETSEVKDEEGATLRADLVPGIAAVLRPLKAQGIKLALVADTHRKNAESLLGKYGLYQLFDAFAISDLLGFEKPDPRIFRYALDLLRISPQDYNRVVMVGNNLQRDVRGANSLGLISVWFRWNDRYPVAPQDESEQPRYTVHSTAELRQLLSQLLEEDDNADRSARG